MSKFVPNEYIFNNDGTVSVVLRSEKYGNQNAIIDAADYKLVSQYRWFLHVKKRRTKFYAMGYKLGDSRGPRILLHRLITGFADGVQVDHRNRNGLDNTGKNLREATNAQNKMNQEKCRNPKSSIYKGVHWNKARRKWIAKIGSPNGRETLGAYTSEQAAGRAYDAAAVERYGIDRVTLNFPEDWSQFATGGIVEGHDIGDDSIPAILDTGCMIPASLVSQIEDLPGDSSSRVKKVA